MFLSVYEKDENRSKSTKVISTDTLITVHIKMTQTVLTHIKYTPHNIMIDIKKK